MTLIPLPEVVYDIRARDGTWCTRKPRCMNFPVCPQSHPDFMTLKGSYGWYAVVEEFDVAAWEAEQREKPHRRNESRKQLRNPRHWQKGVMRRLRQKARMHSNRLNGDIILEIPEACGVDVVRTMARVGVKFEWGLSAKVFRKVMLIGKPVRAF